MVTNVRQILLSLAPLFGLVFGLKAQNEPDRSEFIRRVDSLFQVSEARCKSDSLGLLAETWALRSEVWLQILDNPELKEKYNRYDLHEEAAQSLMKLSGLDKAGKYKGMTATNLAGITLDLCNLGLEDLGNSQKFNSPADAERAVKRLSQCLSTYAETGPNQGQVDRAWKEDGLSWQWIRFYRAVGYRKSGKPGMAEKEYGVLSKLGWKEPILFQEWANLLIENQKPEDAIRLLALGMEAHPEHLGMACQLARLYLANDQLKKAQALLKPLDPHLGFNAELVITKALVYEKKGDYKKADALFKAVYKSDPYEVHTNQEYAGYLLRKAEGAEKSDAEEFAQKAFNLLFRASELSPANESVKNLMASVQNRYPKVKPEPEE